MRKIVLKDEDVLEIIELLKNTDLSYDFIASKYSVKKDHISFINTGKRYTHLTSKENLPIRKVAVKSSKKTMIEKELSKKKIIEIIELLKEGELKFEDIAKQYNINRHSVGKINSGDFEHDFLDNIQFPIRTQHIRQKKGDNSIKLKDEDILKIAKLLKENKLTLKEIAEKFDVSTWTINRINGGHRCVELLKNESFPIRKEQIRPSVGQSSSNAKLLEDDIIEIINLLQNSNESLRAIGRRYDIDNSIIIRINSGKAWTNVTSKYINEYPIRKK